MKYPRRQLCTGETGIQAFLTLKFALTSFICFIVHTYSSLTENAWLFSSSPTSNDLLEVISLFLSVWVHNNSSILRTYTWEHDMPCSKCFTCINSFNLCSKSLRWLHYCHDFTDCGTVRSPQFPQGHQISKWQSCDRSEVRVSFSSPCLVMPNYLKTLGWLWMPSLPLLSLTSSQPRLGRL